MPQDRSSGIGPLPYRNADEAAYTITLAVDHRVDHGDLPIEVALEAYCSAAVRKAYGRLLASVEPLRPSPENPDGDHRGPYR